MQNDPTVVLVDDDKSVRDALKWLLESVELNVVAYSSANEFLQNFNPTTPGCLVLDVRMPGMSGLELQENLAAHNCGLPVIIVTGHADVAMCVRAFEGGAFAFLEKPVNQQQLLDHVQRAIESDIKNRQQALPAGDLNGSLAKLTPREREVMDLLVVGQSMKQIAAKLQISLPTCSKHRSNVLDKLEVDNDVQLVRRVNNWQAPPV